MSILWTPSGEQKMIRVIEVGRERFGERNHRRAGKNGAAAEKGTHSMSPLKENEFRKSLQGNRQRI